MKKSFLLLTLVLISLPFVSAYNGFGYYWYSPSQLLDNEWFVFGLIFIVIFAITYFALGKTMKENKGAAVVISAVIGLFISVAVSRRSYFYGYVGEDIGNYLLAFALILGFIILIKFVTGIIGGIGLFVALGLVYFIFQSIEPYDILPYRLLNTDLVPLWDFLASSEFLILSIIAFIVVLIISGKNLKVSNWLWNPKKSAEEIVIRRGR